MISLQNNSEPVYNVEDLSEEAKKKQILLKMSKYIDMSILVPSLQDIKSAKSKLRKI